MRFTPRPYLSWLHRWASLILLPLFALIIITGAILSFEPIIEDWQSVPAAKEQVDARALLEFLAEVDRGHRARFLSVEEGGLIVLEFRAQGSSQLARFDLATHELFERRRAGTDFFNTMRHLHKDLLLGAATLVEIASYLMLLVIIIGPILAWPRLRHTLMGWHILVGWIALPLVLMVSVTAMLMSLNVGLSQLPRIHAQEGPMGMAPAIEQAMTVGGLTAVHEVRRFKSSAAAVHGLDRNGEGVFLVTRNEVIRHDRFPGLIQELHEGTWAGAWSGGINLLASLILMELLGTGMWSWVRRTRQGCQRTGDADADILLAHASQTGTAARLAELGRQALEAGGARVLHASVAGLSASELKAFRQIFLIVSTAGEGQVPEQARAFLEQLEGADLRGCRFSILALGDRGYPHFCRGGERVREALIAAGAQEALPMLKVDGDPSADWRAWLDRIADMLEIAPGEVGALQGDRPVSLILRERRQLNDPSDPDTHEVWSLRFESAEPLSFRPGDLLLVRPGPGEPARPYSIGSTPNQDPRSLLLTVALVHYRDVDGLERLGKASGLLCRQLREGDPLEARLRAHPDFNPPDDPHRPVIMMAAGCGIAPFMGFMAEQACRRRSGPAWLIFGNRKREGDFFYREQLQDWLDDGHLARLDLAFSRDPDGGGYVQDRLRARADDLIEWLLEREATVYVCGNARTLGDGVRHTLAEILAGHEGVPLAHAIERVRQWESQGKLRMDLIDR